MGGLMSGPSPGLLREPPVTIWLRGRFPLELGVLNDLRTKVTGPGPGQWAEHRAGDTQSLEALSLSLDENVHCGLTHMEWTGSLLDF